MMIGRASACLVQAGMLFAVAAAQPEGKGNPPEEVRKAVPPAKAGTGGAGSPGGAARDGEPKRAAVSSLSPADLAGFSEHPPRVQSLIRRALDLTTKNLTYTFASHDPSRGGMDCSGTVFHVLQSEGVKDAPRQSDEMCRWISGKSVLHLTGKSSSLKDEAFAALRPGDLLFWTGTYPQEKRALPVSHVMIYLGKRARDGRPVIFGASDGRSYEGERRCGVSVFDFQLPKPGSPAAFHGYGSIPGLRP